MSAVYAHYLNEVDTAVHNYDGDWREGQAAFNVLAAMHPQLADSVRSTGLDPFYDDSRLAEFYAWVCEKLENNDDAP